MFRKLLAMVMQLLSAIWIRDNIQQHTLEETKPDIPVEPLIEEGDPTLDLLVKIIDRRFKHIVLSDSAFDPVLYNSINTQIEDHSWFVKMLTYLSKTLQEQLEDIDESVYIDDPLIRGLSRGVPTEKELGKFLSSGGVRTINKAFSELLEQTRDVHYLYMKLRTHPILSDLRKDYCSRQMYKPLEILNEYMDALFLHGKTDDSEKETNGIKSNSVSSGQVHQRR